MKKVLALVVSLVMILSLTLTAGAATATWTGTAGTAWTASGDDMIHAAGTETDWLKVASTTETYQDFTITGKICVAPSVTSGGDDTFLILRDQGTVATGEGGAIVYSTGIRFSFRWGHFGIRNGAANVATPLFDEDDDGLSGVDVGGNYWITNVYAPADNVQYIPFSITLDGDSITAMTINDYDVTGYVEDITLPVTAAGKVTIGSFINPPNIEMGIKDVVITLADETPPASSETSSTSPTTGDASALPILGIVSVLAIAAFVLTSKKVRA